MQKRVFIVIYYNLKGNQQNSNEEKGRLTCASSKKLQVGSEFRLAVGLLEQLSQLLKQEEEEEEEQGRQRKEEAEAVALREVRGGNNCGRRGVSD